MSLKAKELLEFIVGSLVDKPEEVKIKLSEGEEGIVLSLSVNQEDMGKVIGKNGKIIKAIRTLLHTASLKEGKKLQFVLEDRNQKEKGLALPPEGTKEEEGK